jgi:aromatic aminotransferase
VDDEEARRSSGVGWVENTLSALREVREVLWEAVRPMGTVKACGAFYFLVPVPELVEEKEAVDILARRHGVLLMPGSPFGAPQYMRLSYAGIPPEMSLRAVQQLKDGFAELLELSRSRKK